jgi:hypothetical protein
MRCEEACARWEWSVLDHVVHFLCCLCFLWKEGCEVGSRGRVTNLGISV